MLALDHLKRARRLMRGDDPEGSPMQDKTEEVGEVTVVVDDEDLHHVLLGVSTARARAYMSGRLLAAVAGQERAYPRAPELLGEVLGLPLGAFIRYPGDDSQVGRLEVDVGRGMLGNQHASGPIQMAECFLEFVRLRGGAHRRDDLGDERRWRVALLERLQDPVG